jgi:hypothetical protein
MRNHDDLGYPRHGANAGLNLAKLDAESSHFDLKVIPPEELDRTVWQPAAEVACPIHSLVRMAAERVHNEALCRELRQVQVTIRHPGSADVQLSSHTDGRQLAVRVEHVDARISNGTAQWNAASVCTKLTDLVRQRKRCRFRRAVSVEQVYRRVLSQHLRDHPCVESVSTHDQVAQGRNDRGQRVYVLVEEPHREPQDAHVLLPELRSEARGVEQHLGRYDHDGATVE